MTTGYDTSGIQPELPICGPCGQPLPWHLSMCPTLGQPAPQIPDPEGPGVASPAVTPETLAAEQDYEKKLGNAV